MRGWRYWALYVTICLLSAVVGWQRGEIQGLRERVSALGVRISALEQASIQWTPKTSKRHEAPRGQSL